MFWGMVACSLSPLKGKLIRGGSLSTIQAMAVAGLETVTFRVYSTAMVRCRSLGQFATFDKFCFCDAFKDEVIGIEVAAQVKAGSHVRHASLQDDGWGLVARVGVDADACAFYGEFELYSQISPIQFQHIDHKLQAVASGGGVMTQVRTVGWQNVEVGLNGEGLSP